MSSERSTLERQYSELAATLGAIGRWVDGTVVATTRKCGKRSCVCMREPGRGHPVTYLTSKAEGKTVSLYVPRRLEADVREWSGNYRKMKAVVRKMADVQRQLIRLRDE